MMHRLAAVLPMVGSCTAFTDRRQTAWPRLRTLIPVLTVGLLWPYCAPALAAPRQPDSIIAALSTVQRFADSINAGLPGVASQILSATWTESGKEYNPRPQVTAFLDSLRCEPGLPTVLIAKRRASVLVDGKVEVRCVTIWNLPRSGGSVTKVITNERFVVEITPRGGEIADAIALPIIARRHGQPKLMRRELERVGVLAHVAWKNGR